jgi:basic membrane protein A
VFQKDFLGKKDNKMNKFFSISSVLLIVVLLFSASCEKDVNSSNGEIRVAMLANGLTFDDMAFLQSCKTGLEQAKDDFDLVCEYDIDTCSTCYQERLEYFANENFDLIIAVGYMWDSAVVNVSQSFPEIDFVLVDSELSEPQPNALSILFDVDEAAYPLGFLSAWWAQNQDPNDPVVGFVAAMYIDQIRQFVEPYLNGLEMYNQNYSDSVVSLGDYASSFIDSELGQQMADSLITQGADVIYGVGGLTGNGALLKAKEQGKQGIGVDVDQYISYPEVSDILLSSAMKRLDIAIYAVVKSFVDDNFNGGGIYTGNLANMGVATAPYHDYETLIPDSIKTEIENIKAAIIDGGISTGW